MEEDFQIMKPKNTYGYRWEWDNYTNRYLEAAIGEQYTQVVVDKRVRIVWRNEKATQREMTELNIVLGEVTI